MSWKQEGFKDFDVPSMIEFLVNEGFLNDISWKNDSSPRFVVPDNEDEESGIGLWIQHPLVGFREGGQEAGGRFIVEEGQIGEEGKTVLETDDLQAALLKIFELAGDDRYSETTSGADWFDPKDPKYSLSEAAEINSTDGPGSRGRGGSDVPRHTCGDKCRSYGCRFGDRE